MTIKITMQSAEGVNVNSGNGSYLDQMPSTFDTGAGNFGYFRDTFNKSKQYGVAEDKQSGTMIYSEGAALLAGGALTYDLSSHTLTGKLDTLSFGTGLGGVTSSSGVTRSKMSLDETDLSFSGLGLNSAQNDKVHDILYGMMTGDAGAFLNYLAKNAVTFSGGDGADAFAGGRKADRLNGLAGDDKLSGGNGNDQINGGLGADILSGNQGRDIFVYKSVEASTLSDMDTISAFDGAAGDRINLKRIDAEIGSSTNDAFDFIGEAAFSGKAGELRFEVSLDTTMLYGDVDGDGNADFAIQFDSLLSLHERDFVL
ncbi:heme acquisition protein HasA [Rhizobium sp. LjRoot254]|uniref:heme acquisition protein HasA n=1 Tax=Rhizobium sp. LjRoot254 TaxID=3342297 RepID=UPI003ECFC8E2